MKKITIILVLMLAVAGIARSQMIEDFEHIELNVFSAGAEGYMHVVPNPAPDEVNMSTHVVEFRRGADGDPWAGFWSRLPEPLDLSENKYVYVDVWKPVISPVVFKMEPDDAEEVETESMFPQTDVEVWETMVFDFSDMDGLVEVIAFFPDFPETLDLEEDIIIYFDNIRVSGPPEAKAEKDGFDDIDFVWCDFEDPEFTNVVGFSAVEDNDNGYDINGYMVENFEHIPLNVMMGEPEDDSRMYVVSNPDMNEANPSTHVVKFERSQHGVPWGGFWSPLPEPLDLSDNKYVYVDVWKPRISPVFFKVEGGETADLEIESMEPQTKVEEWETMVFDFSEKDGLWNIIAFMPDFVEPVDLEEDIVIYFDNFRLGGPPDEVSVQDVVAEGFDVRVFPNPAHRTVNVEAPEGASVSLIDVTGSMVDHRPAGDGGIRFDLSGLPQGIYLIRVVHEEANVTKRLFVY